MFNHWFFAFSTVFKAEIPYSNKTMAVEKAAARQALTPEQRESFLKIAADPNMALAVFDGGSMYGLVGKEIKDPGQLKPGSRITSASASGPQLSVDVSQNPKLAEELFETRRLGQAAADPEDRTLHVGIVRDGKTQVLGTLNDQLTSPGLDSEETSILVNRGEEFTQVDSAVKKTLVDVRRRAKGDELPKPVDVGARMGEEQPAEKEPAPAEAPKPGEAAEEEVSPEGERRAGASLTSLEDFKGRRLLGRSLLTEDNFTEAIKASREMADSYRGEDGLIVFNRMVDDLAGGDEGRRANAEREVYLFANSYAKALLEAAAGEKGDGRSALLNEAEQLADSLIGRAGGSGDEILKEARESKEIDFRGNSDEVMNSLAQGCHIKAVARARGGKYETGYSIAATNVAVQTGNRRLQAVSLGQLAYNTRHGAEEGGVLDEEQAKKIRGYLGDSIRLYGDNAVLHHNLSVFEKKYGPGEDAKAEAERAKEKLDEGKLYYSRREKQIIERNWSKLTGQKIEETEGGKPSTGAVGGPTEIDEGEGPRVETHSEAEEPAAKQKPASKQSDGERVLSLYLTRQLLSENPEVAERGRRMIALVKAVASGKTPPSDVGGVSTDSLKDREIQDFLEKTGSRSGYAKAVNPVLKESGETREKYLDPAKQLLEHLYPPKKAAEKAPAETEESPQPRERREETSDEETARKRIRLLYAAVSSDSGEVQAIMNSSEGNPADEWINRGLSQPETPAGRAVSKTFEQMEDELMGNLNNKAGEEGKSPAELVLDRVTAVEDPDAQREYAKLASDMLDKRLGRTFNKQERERFRSLAGEKMSDEEKARRRLALMHTMSSPSEDRRAELINQSLDGGDAAVWIRNMHEQQFVGRDGEKHSGNGMSYDEIEESEWAMQANRSSPEDAARKLFTVVAAVKDGAERKKYAQAALSLLRRQTHGVYDNEELRRELVESVGMRIRES